MQKRRILIVDDQPVLSGLIRAVLERTGIYELQEEARSHCVLETARVFRPDLIVLDIEMPGKNGAEVAREIWGDHELSETPIIFLSALIGKHEEGSRATARGPLRFLSKPASPSHLVQAVGQILAPEITSGMPVAA